MALLFIYNISIWFYRLFLQLAALFHPKAKSFIVGRKGIFEKLEKVFSKEQRPVIWMHCASLGEFEQGRPVMEAMKMSYPQYALLLTFFSPSGYEIRKNYQDADYVFYLPMDSRKNAQKFLSIAKPSLALFVKYEFWYHYLNALKQEAIPTILFSAYFQSNQPFFKFYGSLYRKMLACYQQIFVQDESSNILLKGIGQQNVQIVGDTRFDRAFKVLASPIHFAEVAEFKGNRQLIVAGSSWIEDEQLLKVLIEKLPQNQYKLLVVPHEVRTQNINRVLHLFGEKACLWDAEHSTLCQSDVAVVNSMGHLSFLYQYADIAWVGGGFGKGIHNILEPAVFGIPVFFGPKYQRFREAVEMIDKSAVACISNADELKMLIEDDRQLRKMGMNANDYVHTQLGATAKIMTYLSAKCLRSTS